MRPSTIVAPAALTLAACSTIVFQAPRPLFAPDAKVEAKCETYDTLDSLSAAVATYAKEGWRVMQTGSRTTCFIFCSNEPIVCFEKPQGIAPLPSVTTAVAPPPAPPPSGRECMGDSSCDTGEKCVFKGGGAFATGHCAPK